MSPMKFSRGSAENASYFILKKIPLSKGHNILEIKVKSPDNTEEGKYTVTVKYDGGPDPSTLKMTEIDCLGCIVQPKENHLKESLQITYG